ncbi:Alpha/Beta hydrolase protein [Cladochytrium replicatum]|nr:Alpha/Beta hydrolase protein [Cladochytrium replicatum]
MAVLNTTTYNSSASGIPFLAIHGIQGYSKRWARFSSSFPERPVIGVDLRGHGHSTFNAPWSLTQHLNDLVETIAAHPVLSERQFDLIGHSFGGFLSLWLCSRLASKVRAIVLLDPAFMIPGERAAETAKGYLTVATFGSKEEATKSRMLSLNPAYLLRERYMSERQEILRSHPDIDDEVRDHLETVTVDGVVRYKFRWSAPAVICAISEVCSGLPDLGNDPRPKVLLLGAAKASYVKPPQIEAIKSFAGAEKVTVEMLECGHSMTSEMLDNQSCLEHSTIQESRIVLCWARRTAAGHKQNAFVSLLEFIGAERHPTGKVLELWEVLWAAPGKLTDEVTEIEPAYFRQRAAGILEDVPSFKAGRDHRKGSLPMNSKIPHT